MLGTIFKQMKNSCRSTWKWISLISQFLLLSVTKLYKAETVCHDGSWITRVVPGDGSKILLLLQQLLGTLIAKYLMQKVRTSMKTCL